MLTSRDRYLLGKYGLNESDYDAILVGQGGTCALCPKTEAEEGLKLAVDHDHKSGVVRGILCRYHNHRVVGRHTDSELLRRVADYIERDTGFRAPKKRPRKRRKAK